MLADEYSSFVHLLLVTSSFVLVTKSWEVTDPQWDTLLSGYLPLHCTEKHYNRTYMVSEERNRLQMSSRICKSVHCDKIFTQMTFWFLCHAWVSLIASQYHFSSHFVQYGILVIYDCGILRQTLAVVYFSTAVSVEAVLLVQDSAPGVCRRSAAPKTGSEDPWLCCGAAVAHTLGFTRVVTLVLGRTCCLQLELLLDKQAGIIEFHLPLKYRS